MIAPVVRDTTGGESKPRTIGGSAAVIRQHFKAAARAVLQHDDDAPKPRRRSEETTGKAFSVAAKSLLRRAVQVPADAYGTASLFLAQTLEWLQLWEANDIEESGALDDDYNTQQNCGSSPHL